AGRATPQRAAHGRWLELRGRARLRALLVPHDDLRSGRIPRLREGQRHNARGNESAKPGPRVPAGAPSVSAIVIRRSHRAPGGARFTFPTMWRYDVLRALDYFRRAAVVPDERMAEAIGLVVERQRPDGRWPLHEPHPHPVHAALESGADQPSRWNTLRALRVL